MSTGSKTDLLLVKAKLISDGDSTSVITYLRMRKKPKPRQLQPERGMRICERNNSADSKVREAGEGGGAPGTGAQIPLQPVKKTMVR